MKIPNIFKSVLREFVDVDHAIFDNHKRFSIKHGEDEYIITIKHPDIGFPHFRVYKNKISFWNYYCSVELFRARYFKYSMCFTFDKLLRSFFRCKELPSQVLEELQSLLSKPYSINTQFTNWIYLIGAWELDNCGAPFDIEDINMPDYTKLNDDTWYLSTIRVIKRK